MAFTDAPLINKQVDWVFLLAGKQTAYGTPAVGNTLVDRVRGLGFAPWDLSPSFVRDTNRAGRMYATSRREVARDCRASRTFEMSAEMLQFFLSFATGKCSTAPGPPITHTSVFQVAETDGQQVPVFSAYEELYDGTALKRMFSDLAVASLTLRGRAKEICTLQVALVGSGVHAAADIAIPATDLAEHLFHGGNTAFVYGERAADTDATSRLIEWEITLSFNADENNSYTPSSGLYRGQYKIGTPTVTANLLVWADQGSTDIYDDWLASAVREMKISLTGAVIGEGPATHAAEFFIPAFMPTAAPIGERDGKMIYSLSAGAEDLVLDGVSVPDAIFQSTVVNETAAYLQAPGA
jgi:hypothetical protein